MSLCSIIICCENAHTCHHMRHRYATQIALFLVQCSFTLRVISKFKLTEIIFHELTCAESASKNFSRKKEEINFRTVPRTMTVRGARKLNDVSALNCGIGLKSWSFSARKLLFKSECMQKQRCLNHQLCTTSLVQRISNGSEGGSRKITHALLWFAFSINMTITHHANCVRRRVRVCVGSPFGLLVPPVEMLLTLAAS